jgi:hypothetical protein
MQKNPNSIHDDVRRLLEEAEAWKCGDHIYPILDSILTTISTIGYGSFLDGLLDGLFDPHANPNPNSQPFSPTCNVIPSKSSKKSACHPLLLAFSKGDKGKLGFDAIQNKMRSHLAKCRGVTKFVICFTDCWDSTKFQDNHYEGLLTLKKVDGVNFMFIMVGVPDSALGICPVEF